MSLFGNQKNHSSWWLFIMKLHQKRIVLKIVEMAKINNIFRIPKKSECLFSAFCLFWIFVFHIIHSEFSVSPNIYLPPVCILYFSYEKSVNSYICCIFFLVFARSPIFYIILTSFTFNSNSIKCVIKFLFAKVFFWCFCSTELFSIDWIVKKYSKVFSLIKYVIISQCTPLPYKSHLICFQSKQHTRKHTHMKHVLCANQYHFSCIIMGWALVSESF